MDIIENPLKPVLLVQYPFNLKKLLFKMVAELQLRFNKGVSTHAITDVEINLWDWGD